MLLMSRRDHSHPFVRFLDGSFFPWIVTYVISRPHIIFLLGLIFALEYPDTPAVVMLMLGNYTNVISASASAIVLRQQSNQHEVTIEHHEAHEDRFQQVLEELASMRALLAKDTP